MPPSNDMNNNNKDNFLEESIDHAELNITAIDEEIRDTLSKMSSHINTSKISRIQHSRICSR
jgi:hypothetical protein